MGILRQTELTKRVGGSSHQAKSQKALTTCPSSFTLTGPSKPSFPVLFILSTSPWFLVQDGSHASLKSRLNTISGSSLYRRCSVHTAQTQAPAASPCTALSSRPDHTGPTSGSATGHTFPCSSVASTRGCAGSHKPCLAHILQSGTCDTGTTAILASLVGLL